MTTEELQQILTGLYDLREDFINGAFEYTFTEPDEATATCEYLRTIRSAIKALEKVGTRPGLTLKEA